MELKRTDTYISLAAAGNVWAEHSEIDKHKAAKKGQGAKAKNQQTHGKKIKHIIQNWSKLVNLLWWKEDF